MSGEAILPERNPDGVTAVLPAALQPMARQLVEILRGEMIRFLVADQQPDIRLETASFTRITDPSNGEIGYEGVWRNSLNERVGRLIMNSDGSYYAEYDLCVRHPHRPNLFVEAVTAWGRDGEVKVEVRLLPSL